ncbi:MAG: hypothetical protein ACE5EF_05460, partial [Dehalococcoidia bacterium]
GLFQCTRKPKGPKRPIGLRTFPIELLYGQRGAAAATASRAIERTISPAVTSLVITLLQRCG